MERKIGRIIILINTLIFMLILICFPPLIVYAKISKTNENVNIIHYTQILLSLKGSYTGPLDGLCNPQTREAIEKYKNLPTTTKPEEICRIPLLEDLNAKLTASMTEPSADITNIKNDISNIILTIKGINESMSTHFISLSYNMAITGITTLLAAASLIVAFLIGFVNIFINYYVRKYIEDLHANILNETTIRVSTMIDEARLELRELSNTLSQRTS